MNNTPTEVTITITGPSMSGKTQIRQKILELFKDDIMQGEVIVTEEDLKFEGSERTVLVLDQCEGRPMRYFIAEINNDG